MKFHFIYPKTLGQWASPDAAIKIIAPQLFLHAPDGVWLTSVVGIV